MDTAVRLRTAGLEPGRIARLTVLVGDVTGLVPIDGDLGEGDQVSLLDTLEDPDSVRPAEALDETELREILGDAISRLPEREKLVITLYYYEELTLREIGEVLGVTESRISQLHTKAILRLKARLAGAAARA
jgi:RNA polymerase sigma factor (sigma-70 family)